MIEVKYEDVSSEVFTTAIQKLSRAPLNVKAAYAVKKMVDHVNQLRRRMADEFTSEVVEKFSAKDASGNITRDERGMYQILDGQMEAYQTAMEAFGKKTAKIERHKIPLTWIGNAQGISAVDMQALMPLVDEEMGPEGVEANNVLPLNLA